MNIIQVTPGELRIPVETGGGEERLILNTAKRLSLAGHQVTILDRKYSSADPDTEVVEGIPVVRLGARRFNLGGLRKLPKVPFNFANLALNQAVFALYVHRYLKKRESAVIHVHGSMTTILLALMNRSIRRRLFCTSFVGFRTRESPTLRERLAIALEAKAANCCTKAIVFNDDVREAMISKAGVKPEQVVTIPVGIDIDAFNPSLDLGDTREKYGLRKWFTVLFVGVICQRKGVHYLIEAANILINEYGYEQVQFLLVGPIEGFGPWEMTGSPYLDRINLLIHKYRLGQKLRLTGAVPLDDLRKLYAACDIFVLPSVAESTPSAPLEAMSSGKPVIATRVQGMSAEVRDGQTGFLIDPEDERQLAEKIKYLIDNPDHRATMGMCGRRLAEEEFGAVRMVDRLLNLYEATV